MTHIDADVDGPKLTMLASCANGTCPTIFESDRGTYVVQGYPVDAQRAGVTLAPDELLVEIPADLLDRIFAKREPANGG